MRNFIFIIVVSIIISSLITASFADFSKRDRLFLIEEKVILKNLPQNAGGNLRVWIPYPVSDDWQSTDDFKLASVLNPSVIEDEVYGNKILFFSSSHELNKRDIEIMISFKVNRKEYNSFNGAEAAHGDLSRFLKPDRLVPVNGRIKNLAKRISEGKNSDMERVRAIYDYIIDEIAYSKDDPKVCGIGDSLLTLRYKKGICTDYHSLFISLVRSLGIPAKYEIGFPIPDKEQEGRINGYHCWAKFYLKDKGWIPVDISEADKHPEKKDYFFGHIDENRIHLTSGRDITLEYAKDRQPLNFFIYPYVEVNGLQFNDAVIEISFKDLKGGDDHGKLLRSGEDKQGKV